MVNIATEDVLGGWLLFGTPSPEGTLAYRDQVIEQTLLRMVDWSGEVTSAGVCPRLQNMHKGIVAGIPLLQRMLNGHWQTNK